MQPTGVGILGLCRAAAVRLTRTPKRRDSSSRADLCRPVRANTHLPLRQRVHRMAQIALEFGCQSVLGISVPEADAVLSLGSAFDGEVPPVGVNAHITIMYPWMPPALIDEEAISDLTSLFSGFSSFDFSLRVGWFGHEVLLLVPEYDSPFVCMTEAV